MVRYQNRVTYGFVTPSEQQQVTAAYKAYQTAFNEAAKQANYNYNTPTPPNVVGQSIGGYAFLIALMEGTPPHARRRNATAFQ